MHEITPFPAVPTVSLPAALSFAERGEIRLANCARCAKASASSAAAARKAKHPPPNPGAPPRISLPETARRKYSGKMHKK
jgi:hypothetical protein